MFSNTQNTETYNINTNEANKIIFVDKKMGRDNAIVPNYSK